MARVLQRRRRAVGLSGFLNKLLGLDQKMRQYEVGEQFVRGAVAAGGPEVLGYAWRSAEDLPALEELGEPRAWLRRVEHAPVRGRSAAR